MTVNIVSQSTSTRNSPAPETHSFSVQHAAQYGVEEAIVIHCLQWWIGQNHHNGVNRIDDRTWAWNSIEAWSRWFPYWSPSQLRRTLVSLKRQGVITTGHHSKNAYDRTTWYAFVDETAFLGGPPGRRSRAANDDPGADDSESSISTNRSVHSTEPLNGIARSAACNKDVLSTQLGTQLESKNERHDLSSPPARARESQSPSVNRTHQPERSSKAPCWQKPPSPAAAVLDPRCVAFAESYLGHPLNGRQATDFGALLAANPSFIALPDPAWLAAVEAARQWYAREKGHAPVRFGALATALGEQGRRAAEKEALRVKRPAISVAEQSARWERELREEELRKEARRLRALPARPLNGGMVP